MATISTKDYSARPGEAAASRRPSRHSPAWAGSRSDCWPTTGRSTRWAEPLRGSDLKPVMGDAGLPILGHMVEMFRGGPDFWLHLYRTRGPVVLLDSPIIPTVAALGPDAIQAIYSNRNKDFSQQGWAPVIEAFFNRGLMLLDFDEHMYHRRIMQEAFVRTRLVGYHRAGRQGRLAGRSPTTGSPTTPASCCIRR